MRIILQVVTAYSSLVSKQPCHRLKVTIYLYILGHGVIFDPNTILHLCFTKLCNIVQLWSYILALHYIHNTTYLFIVRCLLVRAALPVFTWRHASIYCGKDSASEAACKDLGGKVVRQLLQPLQCEGRYVTTENYFTSLVLARNLLKAKKAPLVGTIRTNRVELPKEFAAPAGREL